MKLDFRKKRCFLVFRVDLHRFKFWLIFGLTSIQLQVE